jgi:hypothetical protein
VPRNTSGLRRGGGRPKGVPNKVSGTFKAALLEAFHKIGGMEEFARWGSEEKNRAIFYQICARLVPTEVAQSADSEPTRHIIEHLYPDKPPAS